MHACVRACVNVRINSPLVSCITLEHSEYIIQSVPACVHACMHTYILYASDKTYQWTGHYALETICGSACSFHICHRSQIRLPRVGF